MEPVRIGIVGIGGYGNAYMTMMSKAEAQGLGRLTSVVVRNRAKYPKQVSELEHKGVAIRSSLDEMLALDGERLEIVALPTGIPTHCPFLIQSVRAGKNVIVEKPPTATIQEMDQMLAALREHGRWAQVGFQSQGSATIMALKRDICAGKFGRISKITVSCKEMRRDNYYSRAGWAGKIRTDEGWILDGSVNNPFAHQIMNALYFAKPVWGEIAEPEWVQAELYRGHDIEAEDTSAVRIQTREGPVIHFFATLCGKANNPIQITIEAEKARIVWGTKGLGGITFHDGRTEPLPVAPQGWANDLFRNAILYLRGEEKELNCPLPMTRNFVLAVNAAWLSAGVPHKIPGTMLNIWHDPKANSRAIEIPGIEELIDLACAEGKLFSELGAPWAVTRKPFSLAGFNHFDLQL